MMNSKLRGMVNIEEEDREIGLVRIVQGFKIQIK